MANDFILIAKIKAFGGNTDWRPSIFICKSYKKQEFEKFVYEWNHRENEGGETTIEYIDRSEASKYIFFTYFGSAHNQIIFDKSELDQYIENILIEHIAGLDDE